MLGDPFGIVVVNATNEQSYHEICNDGAVIVTWRDRRDSTYNIFAQKII